MYTQVSRCVPFDPDKIISIKLPLYDSRTHALKFPIPLFQVSSWPIEQLLYKNSVKFIAASTNPVTVQFTYHNSTGRE